MKTSWFFSLFFLAVLSLGQKTQAALSCQALLETKSSYYELLFRPHITESDILNLAEEKVLGPERNKWTQKGKRWALKFVQFFRQNKDFREKVMIEIERRNLRGAVQVAIENANLNKEIETDPAFEKLKSSALKSWSLSVATNLGANVGFYLLTDSTGIFIYAPQSRFFNPMKLSQEDLNEILSPTPGRPLRTTLRVLSYRGLFAGETALNNMATITNHLILLYVVGATASMIM